MKKLLLIFCIVFTSCQKDMDDVELSPPQFWIEIVSQCEEYEEGEIYEVSGETWYRIEEMDLEPCGMVSFTTLEGKSISGLLGSMSRAGK